MPPGAECAIPHQGVPAKPARARVARPERVSEGRGERHGTQHLCLRLLASPNSTLPDTPPVTETARWHAITTPFLASGRATRSYGTARIAADDVAVLCGFSKPAVRATEGAGVATRSQSGIKPDLVTFAHATRKPRPLRTPVPPLSRDEIPAGGSGHAPSRFFP